MPFKNNRALKIEVDIIEEKLKISVDLSKAITIC